MVAVRVPRLTNACDRTVLATVELKYLNTITSKTCTSSSEVTIARPAASAAAVAAAAAGTTLAPAPDHKNMALDEQRNRIVAAEALEAAATLATQGRMPNAKTLLSEALSKLEASISHTSLFTYDSFYSVRTCT